MTHNELVESDYVLTPEWCAKDMIKFFNPVGKILDPCRGLNKVFYNNLPTADYCEIQENKNFFEYNNKIDWIISNPPYSIFKDWMIHSYKIADNIVYLLPIFKTFNALGLIRLYKKHGWIKHIRVYDSGHSIESGIPWARSRPIVAVYFKKGYTGDTTWSFYNKLETIN